MKLKKFLVTIERKEIENNVQIENKDEARHACLIL